MLPPEHSNRIYAAFDDHRLVANAGLLLPATLAYHLGLGDLVDHHVDLGDAPDRVQAGDKLNLVVAGKGRRLMAGTRAPQTTSWSKSDFRHIGQRNGLKGRRNLDKQSYRRSMWLKREEQHSLSSRHRSNPPQWRLFWCLNDGEGD